MYFARGVDRGKVLFAKALENFFMNRVCLKAGFLCVSPSRCLWTSETSSVIVCADSKACHDALLLCVQSYVCLCEVSTQSVACVNSLSLL